MSPHVAPLGADTPDRARAQFGTSRALAALLLVIAFLSGCTSTGMRQRGDQGANIVTAGIRGSDIDAMVKRMIESINQSGMLSNFVGQPKPPVIKVNTLLNATPVDIDVQTLTMAIIVSLQDRALRTKILEAEQSEYTGKVERAQWRLGVVGTKLENESDLGLSGEIVGIPYRSGAFNIRLRLTDGGTGGWQDAFDISGAAPSALESRGPKNSGTRWDEAAKRRQDLTFHLAAVEESIPHKQSHSIFNSLDFKKLAGDVVRSFAASNLLERFHGDKRIPMISVGPITSGSRLRQSLDGLTDGLVVALRAASEPAGPATREAGNGVAKAGFQAELLPRIRWQRSAAPIVAPDLIFSSQVKVVSTSNRKFKMHHYLFDSQIAEGNQVVWRGTFELDKGEHRPPRL